MSLYLWCVCGDAGTTNTIFKWTQNCFRGSKALAQDLACASAAMFESADILYSGLYRRMLVRLL